MIDPTLYMSADLARKLGCWRIPFDAGGYPVHLTPARPTFIVREPGGAWLAWDFVPDEIATEVTTRVRPGPTQRG